MSLLLIFALVSGLITILAPCIWPLLPIILSATATGGHRKPLGITLGIIISFGIVTLTISYIVRIIPFDPNILRIFSVIVITTLGLTLLIPKLSGILEGYVSRLSGKFAIQRQGNGFWAGLITGFALGIVWTPCAGPILATIATLAATQQVNSSIILVTIVYVIGVGIPLFLFAILGRRIFSGSKLLSPYLGKIQQVFGAIMIITAILIFTNYDKTLQAKLLDLFPSYGNFIINLESNEKVKKQLDNLRGGTNKGDEMIGKPFEMPKSNNLPNLGTAPEFVGISNWLNSKPLMMEGLKGKVVLIDFWTYTCINCIRTLPHVTSWYNKYNDQGFVVVGVHTPEFEFEKDTGNVENAIAQYKILYPVAQDNDYATWNAYSNQYWPAKYLIDKDGNIRYAHFGEGKYEETEKAIQELLRQAGQKVDSSLEQMPDQTPRMRLSPETYLGSARMQYYYPSGTLSNGKSNFKLEENPSPNSFSLGGEWEISDEYSGPSKNSTLTINFYADKVFLVLKPQSSNSATRIYIDGKLVDSNNQGTDVKNGIMNIDSDRLYNLVDLQNGPETHTLKIEFLTPGVKAFAFTFG
ncbi:MAG: cytochrome c biogenesis protein DipZ [Candidatus Levybacteria bacterium]|nr:cytochrome c biogenesis protein DipZ [Candidatus Levybacteria bacterium]